MTIKIIIAKLQILLCQQIKIRARCPETGKTQDAFINGKDIDAQVFITNHLARNRDRHRKMTGWQDFVGQVKIDFQSVAFTVKRNPFGPDGTERTVLIGIKTRTIGRSKNIGAAAPFRTDRDTEFRAIRRKIKFLTPQNVFVGNRYLKSAFERCFDKAIDRITRFDVVGLNRQGKLIGAVGGLPVRPPADMEGMIGRTAGLGIANDRAIISPVIKSAIERNNAIRAGRDDFPINGNVVFFVTRLPATILIEPVVIAFLADPFDLQFMIGDWITRGIQRDCIKCRGLPIRQGIAIKAGSYTNKGVAIAQRQIDGRPAGTAIDIGNLDV